MSEKISTDPGTDAQHQERLAGAPIAPLTPARSVAEGALPIIYVFSNVVGGGDGIALALAADGTILGSHWCSHEGYARGDLGVTPGSRPDRHETYAQHYPGGYAMEFVPHNNIRAHLGLMEAYRLNQLRRDAALGNTEPDDGEALGPSSTHEAGDDNGLNPNLPQGQSTNGLNP